MTMYTSNEFMYGVSLCTNEDVDFHYEKVRVSVTDTPELLYKDCMKLSVAQNTAYKITNQDVLVAFLYVYREGNMFLGTSVWKSDSIAVIILLKHLLNNSDFISLKTGIHAGSRLYFKSLATESSIKEWHYRGKGLITMRRRTIEETCDKILSYIGIS